MHTSRIVALGYDCGDIEETWTIPADKVFSVVGDIETFNGPTYEDCLVPKTDLDFEFYDLSGIQAGNLSWITIHETTFVITVAPQLAEFLAYDDSTI